MGRLRKSGKTMTLLRFLKETIPSVIKYLGVLLHRLREEEKVINYGRWVVDVKYDDVTIRYGFKKCLTTSDRFPHGRVSDLFITKEKNKVHTELHQVRKGYIRKESSELAAKIMESIEIVKCMSLDDEDKTNANYIAEAILRDHSRYGAGWIELGQRRNFK